MGGIAITVPGKRVGGHVLLESIFSMLVIMICFGVAMMIFNSVTANSGSALKTQARIRLHTEAELCKESQLFLDENITCEAYTIERRIKRWNNNDHISILELRAINPDGKILAEHYEIIRH